MQVCCDTPQFRQHLNYKCKVFITWLFIKEQLKSIKAFFFPKYYKSKSVNINVFLNGKIMLMKLLDFGKEDHVYFRCLSSSLQ